MGVLPSTWQLPEKITSRFGTQAGKQRLMQAEGHLLLVLHVPPDADAVERKAALFWRAPDGTWKAGGEARGGLSGLRELLASYKKLVTDLEQRTEHATRAAEYFEIIQALTPVHRSARGLHATLQAAREALPEEKAMIELRDLAYEIERTTELAVGDARAGLDFAVAKRGEEQAELSEHIAQSGHKLNLIAALFLPVTAIATVFGTNLRHGFETVGSPYAFYAMVALAFVVGFGVRAGINRPTKQ